MRFRLIVVSLSLLFSFALWSKYVDRQSIVDLDFATTVKIQERIDTSSRLRLAQAVGDIMEGSTFFASPEVTSGVVVVISIVLFITSIGWKRKFLVVVIPVCFALVVAAEVFGKTIVHHPAPPFFMIKNPTTMFPKYYINEQYSYPSGHAARAVFLGIVVSGIMYGVSRRKDKQSPRLSLPRVFRGASNNIFVLSVVISAIYIGLVSVSRIYLGHHWLSDVVGGAFLGASMGVLAIYILFITMSFPRRRESIFSSE